MWKIVGCRGRRKSGPHVAGNQCRRVGTERNIPRISVPAQCTDCQSTASSRIKLGKSQKRGKRARSEFYSNTATLGLLLV